MMRKIIAKQCTHHIFAHLYEHIYYMHLDTALRSAGYFDIVDYSIDAHTVDGRVTIAIELYSESIDIDAFIGDASSDFLSILEFLDIGILQLECEDLQHLDTPDVQALQEELKQFNAAPWDTDDVFRVSASIVGSSGHVEVCELNIIMGYENIETTLRPLYRQIAGLTLNVLASDIADTHGGFVASEAYATAADRSLLGVVRLGNRLDTGVVRKMLAETIEELRLAGGYERLRRALADTTLLENPPSVERTQRDTGVKMSPDLWRALATRNNVEYLIAAIRLDVKYL